MYSVCWQWLVCTRHLHSTCILTNLIIYVAVQVSFLNHPTWRVSFEKPHLQGFHIWNHSTGSVSLLKPPCRENVTFKLPLASGVRVLLWKAPHREGFTVETTLRSFTIHTTHLVGLNFQITPQGWFYFQNHPQEGFIFRRTPQKNERI